MHTQYDLVKVIDFEDKRFIGAVGIIEKVGMNIDDEMFYTLLFTGTYHNKLVFKEGVPCFYENELEGI